MPGSCPVQCFTHRWGRALFPRFSIVEDSHEYAKTVRDGPPGDCCADCDRGRCRRTEDDRHAKCSRRLHPRHRRPGLSAIGRSGDRFSQDKAQAPDGSYAAYAGPGVTAVVTAAILRTAARPDDPLVAKSLKYLEGFVQPDGGVS